MFCQKCGTELENGQKFCSKCGQQVGVEIKAKKSFSTGQFSSGIGKIEITKNKLPIIIGAAVVICVAFVILLINVIIPSSKYNKAMKLYDSGNYYDAITAFEELGDYKDSTDMAADSEYKYAISLYDSKKYEDALRHFRFLNDYKDSEEYIKNTMWEILFDYYPYDEDMKGKVIGSPSGNNFKFEISICSTEKRDGLIFQYSDELNGSSSISQDVAVFIEKNKDEGKAIGISSMTSLLTMMGIADFDVSKYTDGSALDWSMSSDNKSLSSGLEDSTMESFDSSIDLIMVSVKKEFESNGLGFTLADIGFTSY